MVPGIKVIRNGSYLVSGGVPLSKQTIGIDPAGYSYEWREGGKYPLGKTILCAAVDNQRINHSAMEHTSM